MVEPLVLAHLGAPEHRLHGVKVTSHLSEVFSRPSQPVSLPNVAATYLPLPLRLAKVLHGSTLVLNVYG